MIDLYLIYDIVIQIISKLISRELSVASTKHPSSHSIQRLIVNTRNWSYAATIQIQSCEAQHVTVWKMQQRETIPADVLSDSPTRRPSLIGLSLGIDRMSLRRRSMGSSMRGGGDFNLRSLACKTK